MKILFWQWNAFMQKGMENALKKLNIEYDVLMQIPSDWEQDDVLEGLLEKKLSEVKYDKVLSVNYCPVVSNVCRKFNLIYVSWVYDSPIHIRDISSFVNDCNRIYFFDRGQAEYYQNMGYENVFHMPLAADETVWKSALNSSGAEREKYACDVALVGKLYESDYNYLLGPLPQYERGLLDGIVSAQGKLYGAYILDSMITEDLMTRLNPYYRKASKGTFSVKKEELEYACACEITARERFMALSLLASRCDLHLHTGSNSKNLPDVKNCGYVDYYTQMPSVFRNAKINLNMSLKTIRTGIPLRVLDVMSCHGFLISNYQEELLEYFEPGVDLVIYESVEDLVVKVLFYLGHEEERKAIAENGYRKVKNLFQFDDKLKKMLAL